MKYESIIFSSMENRIITIIGKKRMTISQITKKYLEKFETKSLKPNQVVASAIKTINIKCEYHDMPWFINGTGVYRDWKQIGRAHV